MEFIPVLLQIGQDRIKKSFEKCDYLLQIWEKSSFKKIYQIPLRNKIKHWSFCFNYLLYTLDNDPSEANVLHIIQTYSQEQKKIKIKNLPKIEFKFFSTDGYNLILATENLIHICQMQSMFEGIEDTKIEKEIDGSTIFYEEHKCQQKIQALLNDKEYYGYPQFVIVFETAQNKLDFNKLDVVMDIPSAERKVFQGFKQLRDSFPRDRNYVADPITKCCFRFNSSRVLYAVALRKSGFFDLYADMMHKDSVQIQEYRLKDVDMSLTTFYFELASGKYYQLRHQNQTLIQFDQSEVISDPNFNLTAVPNQLAQNYVTLFSGFKIAQSGDSTICMISHNQFVSVFDILSWKWINHIEFNSEIKALFFQLIYDYNIYQYTYKACVYLNNKDIYTKIEQFFEEKEKISEEKRAFQLKKDYTKFVEIGFPKDSQEIFFLIYNSNEIIMLKNGEEKPLKFQGDDIHIAPIKLSKDDGMSTYAYPIVIRTGYYVLKVYYINQYADGFLEKKYDITDYNYYYFDFHSAYSSELSKNIVLFDDDSAYTYDISTKSVKNKIENVFCVGMTVFQQGNANYALCKETGTSKSHGLKSIDLDTLITKDELRMTVLKNIDVGALSDIFHEGNLARLAFISSVTNLVIIPYLHKNNNKFMGALPTHNYICYKVQDQKLVALKQKGDLVTWNMFTGKYDQPIMKTNLNYDEYSVFQQNKERALLYSNADVENCKDEDYFTKQQLAVNMEDQVPLIKATSFQYKRWKMIEVVDSKKVFIALDFIFPKFDIQRMYLNKNMNAMIVALQYNRVFYYKKVIDFVVVEHDQPQVRWQLIRQIVDFPFNLVEVESSSTISLSCFTEDFSLYVRYSKKLQQFEIRMIDTGELYKTIPQDIMTSTDISLISEEFSKFKWLSNDKFLISNSDGFEKIINIHNNFKEEAFNYKPFHSEYLGSDQSIDRLKKKYQTYKSHYFLFQHHRNPTKMYKHLMTVDENDFTYYEHSFTFQDWSLMDQLQKKQLKVKELYENQIPQLLYNILPGGNMLFHKLYFSQEKIAKIFRFCHPKNEILHHVPFLPNFLEQSPFDLSLGLNQKDFKSIFSVLKYLQLYPIDHHSRTIMRSYPVIISQQLPEFLLYLNSRFLQTTQLQEIDQGQIHVDKITASPWPLDSLLKEKILHNEVNGAAIKLEVLDIPYVYHYMDPTFVDLFKSLANAKNYAYFENKAIKAIIDFNYPLVQRLIVFLLIFPFCCFHIIFVVYMNVVYEKRQEEDLRKTNIGLAVVQIVFSFYFLFNEFRQILNLKLQYITSVWNYIDLIAPAGVIILHGFQFAEFYDVEINIDLQRCVIAISTFFMWLKFLYVLRIFKRTGYLIRMIIEVIYDMGIFLFVLTIVVAAFGDSFLRISLGNEEENQFVTSFVPAVLYAYSMILGGYDTEAFGEVAVPLVWIFWLLCTILGMIVMLNLLIAIISGTYERVIDNQDQAAYQEMAALISENYYLIPIKTREEYADKSRFIIVATDMEKINETRDEVQIQFDNVQQKIEELRTQINKSNEENQQKQTKLQEEQDKIQQKMQSKIGFLKHLLMKQAPVEKFKTQAHKHQLEKVTLLMIQEKTGGYQSWSCNAQRFDGCKSGKNNNLCTDVAEVVFHCKECSYDFCAQCNDNYRDIHEHPLVETTYEKLKNEESSYYGGWYCDGRRFDKCKGEYDNSDKYEILYHDYECNFDLCENCFMNYKNS